MKSRWIVNVLLLVLVLGIGAFIKFRPQQELKVETSYEISSLKLGAVSKLSIEFPAKAPIVFEKKDCDGTRCSSNAAIASIPIELP